MKRGTGLIIVSWNDELLAINETIMAVSVTLSKMTTGRCEAFLGPSTITTTPTRRSSETTQKSSLET